MKLAKALSFVIGCIATASCSDRPDREKFPGPHGRTTDVNQAQTTQAVLGGIDPMNNPLAPAAEPSAAQKVLRGRIQLSKGARANAGMTLFVSARPVAGGPPLAVFRRPAPESFPFEFELSEANQMMEGTDFSGMVILSARLDQYGDPLSRNPGDLGASLTTQVGKTDLSLTLAPEANAP
jgi:hypothetical protein